MRHSSLFHLFTPVSRIKGVGSAVSEAFTRLLPAATRRSGGGLPLVRDLLFHLPTGFIDRRVTFPLRTAPSGIIATFVIKVERHETPKNTHFSKKPYRVICSNETGSLTLVFFNAREDYIKGALPIGTERAVSGRVEIFDGILQMTHPDIILPANELAKIQKIEPVYPMTEGLTSRRIAKIVDEALAKLEELPEWRMTHDQISFKQALIKLHHPESENDLAPDCPARLRLVYDEIMAHQLQLALLRRKMQAQSGAVLKGNDTLTAPLIAALPFNLTNGQQQVLKEINDDLASGKRMTRLLQGDVGSGKTIVALLAMLKAVEEGYQCALMAPTELIARQHYETIKSFLHESRITFLTSSVKGKERESTLAAIASGEAQIIIGTHALFQDKVEFNNLAFVVIDEQHRFGVEQRMALTKKGNAPHILHMTATPIPRTLTMMLYGDMECSLLKEKPANRKAIATRLIARNRYEEVVARLKTALDRGEKSYWICPLVDDAVDSYQLTVNSQQSTDLAAVTTRYAEFTARFGNIVSLVHGRMKSDERNAEMQKFASGETKLLVATTVVEVGVDIRDATIMVIEQAERFGLSQLHQLRGRVGRGDKESSCVLLYSDEVKRNDVLATTPPRNNLSRLSILRETEDGFAIAEEDLKLRGSGDLLGVKQSGDMSTIFVDIAEHASLIEQARNEVKELLNKDPDLTSKNNEAAQILLQLFEREVQNL